MRRTVGIILVLCIILLTGCHSPKEIIREVPVEVIKTEYQTQYIHDSIYQHDSTYIYMKGDTVFKTVDKLKYIERTVHDTLITHDTIPQTITVTEVVEKKVPQWWPVWLFCGLIISGGIVYIIYKFKNKIKI